MPDQRDSDGASDARAAAKPLGLGVIGLGMVADTHARALRELGGLVAVRGVYARSPERRASFAREHGFPAAESIDALLADPSIGAILLLTPPNARLEIVAAACAAGKHLLVEKPIERNAAAAAAVVRMCEAAKVTLGVVFQHRFRAASMALKALIDEGALGALCGAQVAAPLWRPQSYYDEPGRGTFERDGGGVLITQAIHTLDLLLWLVGLPDEVQAMAATTRLHRMEAEDFVAGAMRFPDGAIAALTATTAAFPGAPEQLTLDFERASARLEGGWLRLRHHDGRVEVAGEEGGSGAGGAPMAFTHAWHRAAIEDFAQAVRAGREPVASGRDTLGVHRLIDALLRSAAERRTVSLREAEPSPP